MQSRLEQYLDQVEQELKALPSWEREEWREEARQHLGALVEAHEELGSSREEALQAALAQFGPARSLGRALRSASSVGLAHRRASRELAWSMHVLAWDTVVTVAAMNLLVDGGAARWAALLVLLVGHAIGGAVLGRMTGRSSLSRWVVLPYLLMLLAAVLLPGEGPAFPVGTLAAGAAATLGSLLLGSHAARLSACSAGKEAAERQIG